MTDEAPPAGGGIAEEPIPIWQSFLDDLYLLLTLGVAIPTLSYLVWGLIELASVPQLK